MDDPTILTGMAKIVNRRKVNTKLNLDAIERDLIGGGGLTHQPIKDVDSELNELLKDIKTPAFDRVLIKDPVKPISSVNEISISKLPTRQPDLPKSAPVVPVAASNKIQQFIQNEPIQSDDDILDEELEDLDEALDSGLTSAPIPAPIQTQVQFPRPSYQPIPPPQPYTVPMMPRPPVQMHMPGSMHQMPGHYAQEALQVYANDHNIEESVAEQERLEDLKEKMLADIDELREELQADGISTNRIPEVNMDSPYELVSKVHKQLKRKYDRSRCEDLGQGMVLAATRMLEMACDGEKSYFGFRPDMTGFHRTVRSKMRRMRYEQSQIVSNALEYYNVGPISRMGLELVPSAFLYSLSRREQHGKDNYTPERPAGRTEDRSAALDDLRQFE